MDDQIDLSRYWKVFLQHKTRILAMILLVTGGAAIVSLCLPTTYRATAVLMPKHSSSPSGIGAVASQMGLGNIAGILGGSEDGGFSRVSSILQSRSLAERLINRMDLKKILFEKNWDKSSGKWKSQEPSLGGSIQALKHTINIELDRTNNLLNVSAEFSSPEQAATVVNTYVDELQHFLKDQAQDSAKHNRQFLEQKLVQARIRYLRSGKDLSNFYATKGVSHRGSSFDVDSTTFLQEPVDNGPIVAEDELRINNNLKSLEDKLNDSTTIHNIPQNVYLQYLVRQNELLKQLELMLAHQVEMAIINEQHLAIPSEVLNFEILDPAAIPEDRFRPKRREIVTLSFVISLLIAAGYVFVKEHLERSATTDSSVVHMERVDRSNLRAL